MEPSTDVVLPDLLPYLLAILGLLVLWQYYQLQVMKGRILAIDIFDRSGIRLYVYVVADDPQTCELCRSAHGTVFPPSEVMKRQFSPIKGVCKNPAGCTSFLVGLYGAWPEAQHIVERLQSSHTREPIQLYQHELNGLILGPWDQSISADTDQLGITILEAVLGDGTNQDSAMTKYHQVIEYAREVRHRPLIVPAYFRLVELMTRQGRTNDALRLIEEFESRFKGRNSEPFSPTNKQFGFMSMKKSRLKSTVRSASPVGIT